MKIKYNSLNKSFSVIQDDKSYSTGDREKVSKSDLEKAKTDGVIQKKPNGSWGIISIKAGEWWNANYESRESAQSALKAYQSNKH